MTKKRYTKTKIEKKEIKLKIHSLNLDLSYSEVTELIELIPRSSTLGNLRKDLMKWYSNIK